MTLSKPQKGSLKRSGFPKFIKKQALLEICPDLKQLKICYSQSCPKTYSVCTSSGKWSNLDQIKRKTQKNCYSKKFLQFTTLQGFITETNLITYNL